MIQVRPWQQRRAHKRPDSTLNYLEPLKYKDNTSIARVRLWWQYSSCLKDLSYSAFSCLFSFKRWHYYFGIIWHQRLLDFTGHTIVALWLFSIVPDAFHKHPRSSFSLCFTFEYAVLYIFVGRCQPGRKSNMVKAYRIWSIFRIKHHVQAPDCISHKNRPLLKSSMKQRSPLTHGWTIKIKKKTVTKIGKAKCPLRDERQQVCKTRSCQETRLFSFMHLHFGVLCCTLCPHCNSLSAAIIT